MATTISLLWHKETMRATASGFIPRSVRCFVLTGIVVSIFGCTKGDSDVPISEPEASESNSQDTPHISDSPPSPSSVIAGAATTEDMLETLRKAVESELEQPVFIDVDKLRRDERWAFVTAVSLTADREPIDYSRTKFAHDVADGVFDDWLCALLQNDEGRWTVVALEIGATDAPFVDWPERYGVPRTIVFDR